MNNKISVILPAYNEEKAIGDVIDQIIAVMKKNHYDFEIIVVDDASGDQTMEIAREKGARIIRHDFNKGVGAARKTGVLNCSGEIIVTLDADGTYPINSIPEMLKYIPEYDQVIGLRTSEQGTLKVLRQPVKWIMFKLASFLAGEKIPDLNSGMRVLKKDILLKYLYLIPNGFSCVTTMTLAFLCNGYRIKYVPIEYYKRIGYSKFRPLIDTRDFLFTIFRIIMYFNPLRIFAAFSFLLFTLGIVKTTYDKYFSSLRHIHFLDVAILVSAAVLFAFGLLADLIVTLGKRNHN